MACVPNLTLGNQAMHQLLAEQIVTTPLDLNGGRVAIPDASGLGFEIDLDAVDRLTVR